MNLEDAQSSVVATLSANSTLAGVPVLTDDGSDLNPVLQQHLRTKGLALVVPRPEFVKIGEMSHSGVGHQVAAIEVLVLENRPVNSAGAQGVRIPVEKAVRLVQNALSGTPRSAKANDRYTFVPAEWLLGSVTAGLRPALVKMEIQLAIIPST